MNSTNDVIVFICVNYNGFKETEKYILNIQSLKTDKKLFIIVVDNSNKDHDFKYLNNLIRINNIENNTFVLKTKNEGYFQGLNKGIAFVQENNINPLYYIIGNNDLTFPEDFINNLSKIKTEYNELIIVPDVITIDGSHENPHIKNRISSFKKLSYDIYYSNFYIAKFINIFYKTNLRKSKSFDPKRQEVCQGIGAIYIMTQSFFKYFDRLWEKVFLYCEEAILSAQVKSVGGKIIYDPLLKCFHNESATTSKIHKKEKYDIYRKSYFIARKYL